MNEWYGVLLAQQLSLLRASQHRQRTYGTGCWFPLLSRYGTVTISLRRWQASVPYWAQRPVADVSACPVMISSMLHLLTDIRCSQPRAAHLGL